tara:strand:- start:824 stop:1042 length:219 start_codon:yes stop_codon:yes gene_type:complete
MASASVWKSTSLSKNPNGVGLVVLAKLGTVISYRYRGYLYINLVGGTVLLMPVLPWEQRGLQRVPVRPVPRF